MKLTNADKCAIKVHHRTSEAAQAVIDDKPEKYRGCHVYLCPHCREGWLVGHTRNSGSRWAFPGHFHWLLSDPRGLPFFACKGRLGFFSVDYPYEEAIHA